MSLQLTQLGVFFSLHLAKKSLPGVFIVPSVIILALDKNVVCQVPEEIHSAKFYGLGKHQAPASECILRRSMRGDDGSVQSSSKQLPEFFGDTDGWPSTAHWHMNWDTRVQADQDI